MCYSSALILHGVIVLAAADLSSVVELKPGRRIFRRGYGYDYPNQYGNLGPHFFGAGPVPYSASYGGGLYGASGNYNAGSYGVANGRFNGGAGGGYGSYGRPPPGATHSQATSQVTVTKTEWRSGQSSVGEPGLGGGGMSMDLPGTIPPFVDDGNLGVKDGPYSTVGQTAPLAPPSLP
ncbi:unnamed protein product [Heligmosomoides polygyrus]|uniref:Secreted protein n=1 Tax=Heligmosomoides polygyrus TaxID=6339 RepID=A0A183FZR7_HELPZ|nr:unnamed protein product [Heligmosomoides polygyrus]